MQPQFHNRRSRVPAATEQKESGPLCGLRRPWHGSRQKRIRANRPRDWQHLTGTIFHFSWHNIIFYFLKAVLGGINRN
jgi:hypothetical protein